MSGFNDVAVDTEKKKPPSGFDAVAVDTAPAQTGFDAVAVDESDIGVNRVTLEEDIARVESGENFEPAFTMEDVGNFVKDIPLALAGGIVDGFESLVNASIEQDNERIKFMNSNPQTKAMFGEQEALERREFSDVVPPPKTTGGKLLRGITQFSSGFALTRGRVKSLPPAVRNMVAGAAADVLFIDPHEQRLSDLIESNPSLSNPVTQYLKADPNDSGAEGRFKNAVEGLALGGSIDLLLKGLKVIKAGRNVKVQREVAEEAAKPTLEEVRQAKVAKGLPGNLTAKDLLDRQLTPEDVLKRGEIPEKAGNLNLARQDISRQAKRAETVIAESAGGFQKARRGVQTNEETILLAQAANVKVGDMTKRKAYLAEEILYLRDKLATSAENVVQVAKIARKGSEEDLVRFDQLMGEHVDLQAQVAGAAAEAGRSTQAHRIVAKTEKARQKIISDILQSKGGRETLEQKAKMLADIDDPDKLAKMIPDLFKATKKEKLVEIWINGLLSGIKTQVVNFSSNSLVAAYSIPERFLSAAFGASEDAVRKALGKAPAKDRVFFREAAARASGMLKAMPKAVEAAWKQFRFEESPEMFRNISKIEGRHQAVGGKIGKFIRLPSRALESSDVWFKAINYGGELEALATRDAIRKGKKGAEIAQHVSDLRSDVPPEMAEQAWKNAEVNTFTNPLKEQEGLLAGVAKLAQVGAQRHLLLKSIFPFVRTPANILKFSLERSPFGLFMKDMQNAIKTGGSARNEALSKIALGTAVSMTAATYANAGILTGGGPASPDERRKKRLAGWQPYSVKINGEYHSYARFEPLGTLLGVASDIVEIGKTEHLSKGEYDKLGTLGLLAFSKNATNKTFLRGMTEAIRAIDPDNPKGSPLRFIEQLTASALTPTIVADLAKARDPVVRDVRGIIDRIRSRLPVDIGFGRSTDVPALMNLWGEDIKRDGGPLNNMFSPVYLSKEKNDKVSNELVKLSISPSMPNRVVEGVKLNAEQYTRYVKLAGGEAHKILDGIVHRSDWSKISQGLKEDMFRSVINDQRSLARDRILFEFPELKREVIQRAKEKFQ